MKAECYNVRSDKVNRIYGSTDPPPSTLSLHEDIRDPNFPTVARLMRSHASADSLRTDMELSIAKEPSAVSVPTPVTMKKHSQEVKVEPAAEPGHQSTPPQPIHYYDAGSTVTTASGPRGRRGYAVRLRSLNTDPGGK